MDMQIRKIKRMPETLIDSKHDEVSFPGPLHGVLTVPQVLYLHIQKPNMRISA